MDKGCMEGGQISDSKPHNENAIVYAKISLLDDNISSSLFFPLSHRSQRLNENVLIEELESVRFDVGHLYEHEVPVSDSKHFRNITPRTTPSDQHGSGQMTSYGKSVPVENSNGPKSSSVENGQE
jgi:hypothetical protein